MPPWILTRAYDFAPDGSLQLGQILAKPEDPTHVLQPNGPLKFPDGMRVEYSSREGVSMEENDEPVAHFRAWARSSVISAGGNAGSAKDGSSRSSWHVEKLETYKISPSRAYVEQAMRHGDVEASLKKWRWRKRVYMVTGVRVARGARLRRVNEDYLNFGAEVQVVAPAEVATLGLKAMMGRKKFDSERFDKASDFVFSYRLNEIDYGSQISHRPYRGGEMASADEPGVRYEPSAVIHDFEVFGLVDIPFGGNSKKFELVPVPGHDDLQCYASKE
ncbi:hypothetical protein V8C44DRAFT_191095 [Trichoderma aethiopicum]